MEAIDSVFYPLREFAKDSIRLAKRGHTPDHEEFMKVAVRTAIGVYGDGFCRILCQAHLHPHQHHCRFHLNLSGRTSMLGGRSFIEMQNKLP